MNKNIISLALQGLLRKKHQTLLIVAILTISFAFAVMMISYTSSIAATNAEYRSEVYGTWYGAIPIGYEGDVDFLESTDGVDEVGLSTSYGAVRTSSSSYSIGTIDENFASMGPYLLEGRLPETSGEIAMEANLLSALGCDYTLGQEITMYVYFDYEIDGFTYYAPVQCTFTLTGVINSYTNIWGLTNIDLNSAVIVSEDAEALMADATEKADAEMNGSVASYFFTTSSDADIDAVKTAVNAYLKSTRDVTTEQSITVNSSISATEAEADYNTVYVMLIFVVAIIAVVVIYILQMQSEVRRIVRIRSLGGTKGQVRLLIATETLMLTIPSLIIGTLFGAFGIWLLLKLSVFSGSVSVVVSIPVQVLLIAALAWIFGIFFVRFVTIQVALSTPLTGTMGMQVGKRRFYARFQKALILLMSTVFCGTVIFTAFVLQTPTKVYSYFKESRDYTIGYSTPKSLNKNSKVTDITTDNVIDIASVPGIDYVRAFSDLEADLAIDGESQGSVALLVIDSSQDWAEMFDMSDVDLEAFENGEQILIVTNENFQVIVDGEKVTTDFDLQLEAGDIVSLSAMTDVVTTDDEGNNITQTVTASTVDVEIAKITSALSSNMFEFVTSAIYEPYVIVCSRATVQRLVDLLPEDMSWNYSLSSLLRYEAGDTVGFRRLYAYANETAGYISTDKTLATLVKIAGLEIWQNEREYNSSIMQSYLQQIIMYSVSGVCIAFVVIIILSSTIRLETQREKKRYGILQALGMSRRQRNLRLMGTAFARSVISVALGWGAYRLYDFIINLGTETAEGTTVLVTKSYMSGATPVILTAILFAVVFGISYVSKLGLNKYTLMEMLREDR
ncbi:MAG: ABC transporter permease [Oscillospiraceae bacterium]|nr:ABC transporter permease [Oscillospiraceae bacterium]